MAQSRPLQPASLGATLGLAAPLILAAAASLPPILSGRGGIDLSVGPLMGLVNVVVVRWLIEGLGWSSPLAIVPAALLLGLASGALNGWIAAYVRIQPIIATLANLPALCRPGADHLALAHGARHQPGSSPSPTFGPGCRWWLWPWRGGS